MFLITIMYTFFHDLRTHRLTSSVDSILYSGSTEHPHLTMVCIFIEKFSKYNQIALVRKVWYSNARFGGATWVVVKRGEV